MSGHYTPGPWRAEYDQILGHGYGKDWPIISAAAKSIPHDGEFYPPCLGRVKFSDDMTREEQAANARLIAAAPELVEALRIAEHRAEQATRNTVLDAVTREWLAGIVTAARAALQKAGVSA